MRSCLLPVALLALLALPAIAADSGPSDSPSPGAATTAALDPFGFREDQYSAWGLVDVPYPYQGRHGCYPVGNGICFAHLGVSADFNTLRGITGPGYQTHTPGGETEWWAEGEWPDMRVKLVYSQQRAGSEGHWRYKPVQWETQSIQVLRGAAMVRTVMRKGGMALYCMSYAEPAKASIKQEFVLSGADPAERLQLMLDRTGAVLDSQSFGRIQGDKLLVDCATPPSVIDRDGETLLEGLPLSWNGQECLRFSTSMLFYRSGEVYGRSADRRQEIRPEYFDRLNSEINQPDSIATTYAYWQDWSSKTRRFDTGNQKLDDLMLQVPVIIETQRDAASGGVAPMVSYHGYWVRDTTGPLLCYLENGRFDEVRRMLTYHRKASWKLGACRMSVPLDIDVSDVREPVGLGVPAPSGRRHNDGGATPPVPAWNTVSVEHAEVPSLIVLQHYWYWKARRERGLPDDGYIAEAWPYLRRNLFGMPFDPTYGVKFHGDETYAHGALYSTFDNDTTEDGAMPGSGQPLGYPNGYIPTDFFNRDNTMMHREAAKALAEMASELGQMQDVDAAHKIIAQIDEILGRYEGAAISPVTGQSWTLPFRNIDHGAALFGWADTYTTERTWDECFMRDQDEQYTSCAGSPYLTGHAQAAWLSALMAQEFGYRARTVIASLQVLAEPDGAWCEIYTSPVFPELFWSRDDKVRYRPAPGCGLPVNVYGRINRIRPWESGVNYYALARALPRLDQARKAPPNDIGLLMTSSPPKQDDTQLLVLTRDNRYKEVIDSDFRLAAIPDSDVTAWDIGLPITVDDLRHALLWEEGDVDYLVPFLYLDRDVQLADRRTFKTSAFWESPEMLQLMADYRAAGGIVLEEAELRPAWELTAELWSYRGSNGKEGSPPRLGIHLRADGPAGSYNCKLDYEPDHLTLQRMLASSGVLPSPDGFYAELELEPGVDKYISLDEALWTSLIWTTGKATVEYTSPEGKQSTHTQILRPNRSLASRIEHNADELPMQELPAASFMSPQIDGVLQPWDGGRRSEWTTYPSLGLLTSDAHILSGSFSPGGGDAGLSLCFGYDAQYLYIAGTMIDDQIVSGGLWQSERINFVFDARLDSTKAAYPDGSVDKNLWQADDYWIVLAPFCTDGGPEPAPLVQRIGGAAPLAAGGGWDEGQRGFYGPVSGARCALRMHEDGRGYDFELAMPLSGLPFLDPRPESCCGFGVFISDMDAGVTDASADGSSEASADAQTAALAEAMWLTDWRAPGGGISWNFWDCGLLYFAR